MKRAILWALLCAAAAPAAAAVSVTAELSHSRVPLDEPVTLAVTVSGDKTSLPDPQLPPIESFSVYDSGRSQSINFINGRVTASVVYTYVLTPRAAGKFHIPPIGAAGASPSAPLDVEVVAAGASAAPEPASGAQAAPDAETPQPAGRHASVFVAAALDKPRALVNEQVTLTVRFYYAVQLLGNSQYEAPPLTGFLLEDLPPVRENATTIDGHLYHYSEIKTALFPVQPGRLTIGPAVVHAQVARASRSSLGQDFFENFFSMASPQQLVLRSDPLTLQVDPPPPGKPDGFTGVVGRLTARAALDHDAVKAGEAVTLTVSVNGTGDVKSVGEPAKPDLPALRFFETDSSVVVEKKADRVGGVKTFRTVVVPRVSGDVSVPAFDFPYYDPQLKAYARATTAPLTLHVAPGAAASPLTTASPAAAPELTAIADDIRYLKTAPESAPLTQALIAFADLGGWHAAPLAFLLVASLLAWRRRAADADPRGRRFREARRRAEERLKAAAGLSSAAEAARAAALLGEALTGFVADKLDVTAAGLTVKSALEGLKSLRRPPSPATLERLRAAWEEADLHRFAPGGVAADDAGRFAAEAAALIKTLDEEVAR